MESLKNFIVDNWQFISSAILAVLSILAIILKRKSKTEIIDNGLYKKIVDLVIQAENVIGEGHGEEKLNFVIKQLSSDFNPWTGKYIPESMLKDLVEYVLTTPQKKGVKDGKK